MMMALAIAHHIREQVVFTQEEFIVPPTYRFNIEKKNEVGYDYGEEMTVV